MLVLAFLATDETHPSIFLFDSTLFLFTTIYQTYSIFFQCAGLDYPGTKQDLPQCNACTVVADYCKKATEAHTQCLDGTKCVLTLCFDLTESSTDILFLRLSSSDSYLRFSGFDNSKFL